MRRAYAVMTEGYGNIGGYMANFENAFAQEPNDFEEENQPSNPSAKFKTPNF